MDCCCHFNLRFIDEAQWVLEFGEVIEVEHGYDPYPGPYEVIPKTYDQILPTKDKNMSDDVTVFEIPYAEVSNPDGTTVNIAYL